MRRVPVPSWLLAGLVVVPLFIWWLGWHPGFASPDTIHQWRQAQGGQLSNFHPAIHTLYLKYFSLGTEQPGLISLFQLLVFSGLLVYGAKRLVDAGVPTWLAVAAAWLLGLSPAIAPTTLALWKDVVFGLFMLWAWIELLGIATDRKRIESWVPLTRLGIALGGIWLFRGNGPITVVLVIGVLVWVFRRHLRGIAIVAASLAIVVILVMGPIYTLADVRRQGIEIAQVFIPDLAATFINDPANFDGADLEMIEALAPTPVWKESYDCFDSTLLTFNSEFDHDPILEDPRGYLALQFGSFVGDIGAVVGHRTCAANFIFVPGQPAAAYFHRPPFEIPSNDMGLERDPISQVAYTATLRVWQWAEVDSRLWLTWRPAIVILPTILAIIAFALIPAGRRFLLPSSLFAAHLINVTLTSPTQEFRFVYTLYVIGVLTLTLLYPVLRSRPPTRR